MPEATSKEPVNATVYKTCPICAVMLPCGIHGDQVEIDISDAEIRDRLHASMRKVRIVPARVIPDGAAALCINCYRAIALDMISHHFAVNDADAQTVGPLCDSCAAIIEGFALARHRHSFGEAQPAASVVAEEPSRKASSGTLAAVLLEQIQILRQIQAPQRLIDVAERVLSEAEAWERAERSQGPATNDH